MILQIEFGFAAPAAEQTDSFQSMFCFSCENLSGHSFAILFPGPYFSCTDILVYFSARIRLSILLSLFIMFSVFLASLVIDFFLKSFIYSLFSWQFLPTLTPLDPLPSGCHLKPNRNLKDINKIHNIKQKLAHQNWKSKQLERK